MARTMDVAPVGVRVETTARMLDTSPSKVRDLIKTGVLPARKLGRTWRVRVEDIDALLRDREAS